jgi:DNA replication protein DnaC
MSETKFHTHTERQAKTVFQIVVKIYNHRKLNWFLSYLTTLVQLQKLLKTVNELEVWENFQVVTRGLYQTGETEETHRSSYKQNVSYIIVSKKLPIMYTVN